MKSNFFTQTFLLLLISANLCAQKTITPDVDKLTLHLSDYKDLDARVNKLLGFGFNKIDWPIHKSLSDLKNSTYQITKDTVQTIFEIIHGEDKEVFQVNMYQGYSANKWSTLTDTKKMETAKFLFYNVLDMINKEYDETQRGLRMLRGAYKETDYDVPEAFLKGLDDGQLGYFAYWGPFLYQPIELRSYNARLIKITVCDPKAMKEYYNKLRKKN